MKSKFFPNVIKIINDKVSVDTQWKKSIRKATILLGKSILSTDLPQAFMYNMIALETLLTHRGDKFPNVIVKRLNVLFSWLFSRQPGYWGQIITDLYTLRNKMVHSGDTSGIKTKNLLYSDILIENLLFNLSIATKIIQSKAEIIDLSKRLEAKNVLGLKYKTPFKARFSWPASFGKKVDNVKAKMSWP